MLRFQENGLEWLEFESLAEQKGFMHRIYLKHGGLSQGEFESLNFSYQVGDRDEAVEGNLRKVIEHTHLKSLVRGKLSHGDGIAVVESADSCPEGTFDAIVTQSPGLGLLITHADCQAAVIYDPIQHVMANVHCGWRGNVCNIYQKTVQTLHKTYGSKPENLLVGISPSLGPQHAEFVHYRSELPEEFCEFQVRPSYFDFWAIAKWQFGEAGVLPHHIECAHICTYEERDDYFSYRREKRTGRHGTVAALLPA